MRLASVTLAAMLLASSAVAEDSTMIVFDFSSSMTERVDGDRKIDIAKKALDGVLSGLPQSDSLGLTVFGAGVNSNKCHDVKVVFSPGPNNLEHIRREIRETTPTGGTPLSQAIYDAAVHMDYKNKPATLVLMSDGVETCNYDPCETARQLSRDGKDLKIHVIGFALSSGQDDKVSCIASNSGGTYYPAKSAASLVAALSKSLQRRSVGTGIGGALKRYGATTD